MRDSLRTYKKYADEYGFIPNLGPGLWVNNPITGQEEFVTDSGLRYVYERDAAGNILRNEAGDPYLVRNGNVNPVLSDQNPILQLLYHLVPGVKSGTEIHDMQMKQLEEARIDQYVQDMPEQEAREKSKLTNSELIFSAPSSAFGTIAASIGVLLDIPNWKKNFEKIGQSYELRK